MTFLENNVLAVVEPAGAAAQTALTSETVDMSESDSCTFIALLGDVSDTCVLTLTVHHSDEASANFVATTLSATFTAGATDADSKILAVECRYPLKRYLRGVLTRTTANAVVGGIISIKSEPRTAPVTQDATVIASTIAASPATA